MNQRILTIAVIVVLALGGVFFAYRQLVPPPDENTGPVYSTQEVTRGDITVGVEITGSLNPSSGGSIQIPGGYGSSASFGSFVVDEILVEEGTPVKQGQILLRLSAPDLKNKIESLTDQLKSEKKTLAELMDVPVEDVYRIDPSSGITLRAPIAGRIVNLNASESAETIKQGEIVARVVDDSHFKATAKLVPAEYKKAEVGQKVMLRFSQFHGLLEAKLVDVNPNPIPYKSSELDSRTSSGSGSNEDTYEFIYLATIEGKNPGLIHPGMHTNVGLVTDPTGDTAVDETQAVWLCHSAEIEGYIKEERVINRADAIATRVYVREMQMVAAGDPIVSLAGKDAQEDIEKRLDKIRDLERELGELQTQFSQLDVTSPMEGIVASIEKQEGQTAEAGEWIGHVYNTSDMRMWGQVDDIDVLLVQQEAPVEVTVDALPGKTLKGKVEYVDTMGHEQGGITRFQVNIRVVGSPELRPGMRAKAHVDAGSAEDVLLIPLEAVFEEDGKSKVEILESDGTVKVVTVQLGLMNHRSAEVKEGLEEGQLVITGSTADLLPSQRIQSDNLLPGKPDDGEEGNGSGVQESSSKE